MNRSRLPDSWSKCPAPLFSSGRRMPPRPGVIEPGGSTMAVSGSVRHRRRRSQRPAAADGPPSTTAAAITRCAARMAWSAGHSGTPVFPPEPPIDWRVRQRIVRTPAPRSGVCDRHGPMDATGSAPQRPGLAHLRSQTCHSIVGVRSRRRNIKDDRPPSSKCRCSPARRSSITSSARSRSSCAATGRSAQAAEDLSHVVEPG
jgi:hypothetical protein